MDNEVLLQLSKRWAVYLLVALGIGVGVAVILILFIYRDFILGQRFGYEIVIGMTVFILVGVVFIFAIQRLPKQWYTTGVSNSSQNITQANISPTDSQKQDYMTTSDDNVYILITQCLQNGFFLADENRLCLPRDIVLRMLVGDQRDAGGKVVDNTHIGLADRKNRRHIEMKYLRRGPLYRFFDSLTSRPPVNHSLHIINIRDWHAPSPHYDEERRLYGIHCEANTWESEFIDGFEKFLAPWEKDQNVQGASAAASLNGYVCKRNETANLIQDQDGQFHIYDVRSDSVFDFKTPTSAELINRLATIREESGRDDADSHLQILLDQLIKENQKQGKRIYVLVIGVYTDIKVKNLMLGLRTRYDIDSDALFVSDVLTDAPTLERHLGGLDFANKVLNVQVIHSLNDMVSILNSNVQDVVEDDLIQSTVNFREYANYFLDRQYLLAFQDQRLLRYLELTGARSAQVYDEVFKANQFLIQIGRIFLILNIILIVGRIFGSRIGLEIPNEALATTLGVSALQVLTSFFLIPSLQMKNNVNSLVRLRNYLETYSNVTGLLRYHLTKAERMQPNLSDPSFDDRAKKELYFLEQQIYIIQRAAYDLSQIFYDLTPGAKRPNEAYTLQRPIEPESKPVVPEPPPQPEALASATPAPTASPAPPLPPDGGQGVG